MRKRSKAKTNAERGGIRAVVTVVGRHAVPQGGVNTVLPGEGGVACRGDTGCQEADLNTK